RNFPVAIAWRDKLDECAAWGCGRSGDPRIAMTAMLEHSRGHVREAQAALDVLIAKEGSTNPYWIASQFAWRDDREHAFEWLEKAYATRDEDLSSIKGDITMQTLRGDPRYAALLKKMK